MIDLFDRIFKKTFSWIYFVQTSRVVVLPIIIVAKYSDVELQQTSDLKT